MTDHSTLGTTNALTLPAGTIRYRDVGNGPPVVFVHGLFANSTLWRKVVPLLAEHHRCILPDWPLGAHPAPMRSHADLSMSGLARLVGEFLAALDLRDVTLVGNDTGSVVCQFVITAHPERISRLVLTDCHAHDTSLPLPVRWVQWGCTPGFVQLLSAVLRVRAVHRLPVAFGWLTKRPIERAVLDGYLAPMMADAAIRRDLKKVLRGILPLRRTLDVATRLHTFAEPVLIVWANEDRLFPLRYGEYLRTLFPDARLVTVPDSYTFIPEDQPGVLAEQIAAFVREPALATA